MWALIRNSVVYGSCFYTHTRTHKLINLTISFAFYASEHAWKLNEMHSDCGSCFFIFLFFRNPIIDWLMENSYDQITESACKCAFREFKRRIDLMYFRDDKRFWKKKKTDWDKITGKWISLFGRNCAILFLNYITRWCVNRSLIWHLPTECLWSSNWTLSVMISTLNFFLHHSVVGFLIPAAQKVLISFLI